MQLYTQISPNLSLPKRGVFVTPFSGVDDGMTRLRFSLSGIEGKGRSSGHTVMARSGAALAMTISGNRGFNSGNVVN
jgi:hypothetical protein